MTDDELSAIDVIRGKLKERRISNSEIRAELLISAPYISMMLRGSCVMHFDTFNFLCGKAGLNPKAIRERFPGDFDESGNIAAVGWRPRDIN